MTAKTATNTRTTTVKGSKIQPTMATDTTLDTGLVEKAVAAVLKYHETKSQQSDGKLSLLGNERPVHVQFTLLREPGHSKPKPVQIVVPHPFYKLADRSNQNEDEIEEAEICLIVKDSAKPWCQEMIENFPQYMSCIKKVLTLTSLRKKYTTYEQKRELLHKYNVFMADDRILPMLSKALGKAFIKTKRLPVPIDLTRQKALPFAIQKALSATYMTVNTGTCITIRAGHTGMEEKKLVENIVAITKEAVPKMPRKWANVQLIGIKTADSISLPVYNKTPEALREIAKLAGIKEDMGVGADTSDVSAELDGDLNETAVNKKKRSMKSPLLTALKKQKLEEEKEKKERTANTKQLEKLSSNSSMPKNTSKRETSDVVEAVKKTRNDNGSIKTKKTELREKEIAEDEGSPKKKQKMEHKKDEVVKKTKDDTGNIKTKKIDSIKKEIAEDEASPKKKQKSEHKKDDEGDETTKDFIKAKKFKGSKKGYVFKMGSQGLGYYVDVKPVVDKAAMEAINRLGKNKSHRGGQKKNKYKGTRRF
ncbi:ribosomal protein L1p/L10e [Nitzschia inconspicua]|uniref:Ribosomal protein L1p/L10e n=1 Tax=Nitzschia inconspicua TaxID=303405 RepID=A0A9K3PS90_9STRA|nr:ribosomal protein L1p/L10e [Nitzschia inconspicua]